MVTACLDETRMAKKRTESNSTSSSKKKHAAHLRYGSHTPAELREGAVQLRLFASELDAFAATSEEMGVDALQVDGTTKLGRGQTLLSQFLEAVERAIVSEKYRRKR